MKPLILLVVVFILSLALTAAFGTIDLILPGRIAMAVMLIFTAIGHFRFAEGMSLMVPRILPFRKTLVFVSGLIEIIAGIGLVMPFGWAERSGWFLVVFFILLLPANINAAIMHVDYEKANYKGAGPSYLWFRIPLQVFFIAWVYYFAILHNNR